MSGQASTHFPERHTARWSRTLASRIGLSIFLTCAIGALGLAASAQPAQADGIYVGSGGFGITFGTGGHRNGIFYGTRSYYVGPNYYGYPYRPYRYRVPYIYRPYMRRYYSARPRVYVNPPLRLAQPQRVPYTKTGLAPFSPDWVAYCARKFRSFNPNTGTYLAYSGKYRFCR